MGDCVFQSVLPPALVKMASPIHSTPLFSAGWRTHHATHSLDATGEHHVQEVLHGERCLEFRSHPVGDLHLREAALVPAGQQRGKSSLKLFQKQPLVLVFSVDITKGHFQYLCTH